MSDIAIRVDGLSKRYRIGQLERYVALRDVVARSLTLPFVRLSSIFRDNGVGRSAGPSTSPEHIWALDDVSFEIRHAEVVGIIGRNGAGKTTLLRILSRITQPTKGYAQIRGRVGSLLEVGTGFHPELTGRENVYLNGAILGMRKAEIDRKLDEIVSFAEVEKFIDTPVKRYSSGMRVRLAFAVAAHLEPEILLVDEVLAVGDVAFQKKCLGKMGDVAKEGRTVLFVSHNMAIINSLCAQTFWLDGGRLRLHGNTEQVVSSYLSDGCQLSPICDLALAPQDASGLIRFHRICVIDDEGIPSANIDMRRPFQVELEYTILRPSPPLLIALRFINYQGLIVFATRDLDGALRPDQGRPPGRYRARVTIVGTFLPPGQYTLSVHADIRNVRTLCSYDGALSFQIHETGLNAGTVEKRAGLVTPTFPWQTHFESLPHVSEVCP